MDGDDLTPPEIIRGMWEECRNFFGRVNRGLESRSKNTQETNSLLRRVLDWEGISFVAFLTIAFGLLALPHQYWWARLFFFLAGISLALKIALNVEANLYPRVLIAVLVATLAGMSINKVNTWVGSLEFEEYSKLNPRTVVVRQTVPQSEVKSPSASRKREVHPNPLDPFDGTPNSKVADFAIGEGNKLLNSVRPCQQGLNEALQKDTDAKDQSHAQTTAYLRMLKCKVEEYGTDLRNVRASFIYRLGLAERDVDGDKALDELINEDIDFKRLSCWDFQTAGDYFQNLGAKLKAKPD